jgi:hypothetical protein
MIDKLGLDGLGGASVRKPKVVNKLTALIEAAKAATSPYADDWESKQALLKFDRAATPTTILELCALLENAEEALQWHTAMTRPIARTDEILAAIKQWKGQT